MFCIWPKIKIIKKVFIFLPLHMAIFGKISGTEFFLLLLFKMHASSKYLTYLSCMTINSLSVVCSSWQFDFTRTIYFEEWMKFVSANICCFLHGQHTPFRFISLQQRNYLNNYGVNMQS